MLSSFPNCSKLCNGAISVIFEFVDNMVDGVFIMDLSLNPFDSVIEPFTNLLKDDKLIMF